MLGDDAFRRSVMNAVGSIWLIEGSPADTLEDVREQERLYARLRGDLTPEREGGGRYARLADLATATSWLGVEVDLPRPRSRSRTLATGRAPSPHPRKSPAGWRRLAQNGEVSLEKNASSVGAMEDPDRADITVEMCERVVSAAEYSSTIRAAPWAMMGARRRRSATPAITSGRIKDRNFTRRRKREGS